MDTGIYETLQDRPKHPIQKSMKHWFTMLTSNAEALAEIKIMCGIFQEDVLSPSIFCVALNPLSNIILSHQHWHEVWPWLVVEKGKVKQTNDLQLNIRNIQDVEVSQILQRQEHVKHEFKSKATHLYFKTSAQVQTEWSKHDLSH
jgi:hypothetical protein